ncbi:MAG: aldehyde dehydrogenase [Acidobacteriaceae bacterium]
MTQAGTSTLLLETGDLRRAQMAWAAQPLPARLAVLRRFRRTLAANPGNLLESTAQHRGVSELEALASEVMPLADACRWLEGNAGNLLSTRAVGGAAPLLMRGIHVEIIREPLGLVLIVAPGNYPLFLAGVQALQALVAGNAVLLKPAPKTTQLLTRLRDLLLVSGLPLDVLTLLPEDTEALREVVCAPYGPDHIIVTGSARTGRAFQQLIADSGRPIGFTAELSGADVCIALPSANWNGLARSLRFAVNLNRGRTCIAPRVVLAPRDREAELIGHLQREFKGLPAEPFSQEESHRFAQVLSLALKLGAELVHIENSPVAVLRHLPLDMEFPWDELFSPLLFLATYRSLEEAISIQRRMPLALGAAIFGNAAQARAVAARLDAGSITINDLVAPTADPRLPFSARKASGHGVTRGAEGLLALTTAKAVATQRSRFHPHWNLPQPGDDHLLRTLFRLQHATWRSRLSALPSVVRALCSRRSST